MSRLEVGIKSGSPLQLYEAMWGPIYEAVLNILGTTSTILPIGDFHHGQPNTTTFKTVGEEQITFTWSLPPASFDTPLNLTSRDSYQGIVPIMTFNGIDEEAHSPDAAYWSRGDGSNDSPVSMGVWVKVGNIAAVTYMLARWAVSNLEWLFGIDDSEQPLFIIRDDSAGAQANITSDTALTQDTWAYIVITYDGTGGATALADPNAVIYINGAKVASTITNNGSYVAMEDKTVTTGLGLDQADSVYFNGSMAGGPLGPFFSPTELSADAVLRLYEIGRRALAL